MAELEMRSSEDPAEALRVAGRFLLTEPVRHSVLLAIVSRRAEHPEPGRYWWAEAGPVVQWAAGFLSDVGGLPDPAAPSNAIYRRVGYEPLTEIVSYRFG